jgi:hypothetical protein
MHGATFWNGKISAELVDIITESNPIPPTKKKKIVHDLETGHWKAWLFEGLTSQ